MEKMNDNLSEQDAIRMLRVRAAVARLRKQGLQSSLQIVLHLTQKISDPEPSPIKRKISTTQSSQQQQQQQHNNKRQKSMANSKHNSTVLFSSGFSTLSEWEQHEKENNNAHSADTIHQKPVEKRKRSTTTTTAASSSTSTNTPDSQTNSNKKQRQQ
mmetsp:Transcript_7902/g.11985  ORF Transcript_7902/g.11985 Transcript_7902/m.11985 type:complete len:157 (+) Transcript_7902:233-703(+)